MLTALRSAMALRPSVFSGSLPNSMTTKPAAVRFATGPRQPDPKQDQESITADTMSSFGEGYATRSEEEGFGGIHGGNQATSEDNGLLKKPSGEFDHSQGSEVKEKEKARNQSKIAS